MTGVTWLAFALGAGLGAPLRFTIAGAVEYGDGSIRHRGTLAVNSLGSLLLGVITALTMSGRVPSEIGTIVGSGFCGALTTFSTFAVETVRLLEVGEIEHALKTIALNTSIAIGLATIGYAVVLAFA